MSELSWSTRDTCVICGGKDLSQLTKFSRFPAFLGCVDSPSEADILSPLTMLQCEECACVQVAELAPIEILYGIPHADAPGEVWEKHWDQLSQFACEWAGPKVLEVGGGNGRLAMKTLAAKDDFVSWTIIEPNPQNVVLDHPKLGFEVAWLDESYQLPNGTDTILFSHVFEHLHHPAESLKYLATTDAKRIIVSYPDMRAGLSRFDSNVLHFEHTYFADKSLLTRLFSRFGYALKACEDYGPGHSLFFCFEKCSVKAGSVYDSSITPMFKEYYSYFAEDVERITDAVRGHDGPCFLCPASIFTQTYFGYGLEESLFESLLDNSPLKIGRRLYGTQLQTASPKVLANIKNPLVVLRAGLYLPEIRKGIEAINSSTVFV